MHRDGHDPENIQSEDILCDFCGRSTWSLDIPSIEGHHGSILCCDCLDRAWQDRIEEKNPGQTGAPEAGWTCTMCLESSDDGLWVSPLRAEGRICRRCIKQAAGVLHKCRDWSWTKPDQSES
jgi:hypothetical protein